MKNHNRYVTLAIALLVVLAAMCITASAGKTGCTFSNWYNGTVHGGIYVDVKGYYNNPNVTQTYTFENVPDGREIVRFYPGIWLGSPDPGRVTNWTITINGHTDSYNFTEPDSLPFCDWDIPPEDGTGEHCTVSCTGCGQCSVTYNASPYIVTGDNIITFWTSEQIDQFALLVVYENESMPEMQYWIKEGHVYLAPGDAPYYVDFAETPNTGPIEPYLISSVEYFTYGCPRPPGKYAYEGGHWPCLNGNNLTAPNIAYHNGYCNVSYYWTSIPPGYITSASNRFLYSTLPDPSARLWVTFLALTYGHPDLNVSSIAINPGDTRAEDIVRVYVNGSNNISAVVSNNGYGDAGAFDVCFAVKNSTSTYRIGRVEVASLTAGASTTVSIDWIPTCANFSSVLSEFPYTSEAFGINVTADCNCTDCPTCAADGSNGKIAESDETNNKFSKFIPAIQLYSGYNVIGGVVNNGYRSKNVDCNLSEEPLTLFEYDSEIVGGGIAYNVSGEKIYSFAPGDNSTRIHHIDIPPDATVKKARLYVYWYDKWGNYNTYPTGCLANLSVNFSGTGFMPEVKYTDAKGFGYYLSPKGTYAYNVTSKVAGSGDYTAIIENIDPNPNNSTTLLGELLYVVYEGTAGKTTQLWTLEGNDLLMQGNITHPNVNDHSFSVDKDEATATVAFPGTVDPAIVSSATLISVVVQGMAPGSNMLFNDAVIKTDAWDSPTEASPNSKVNVESVDVKSYLTSSGNNMGFSDTGTAGMQASNAFLVVEYYPCIELHNGWNFVSTPKRLADGYKTASIVFNKSTIDTAGHSIFKYNTSAGNWTAMSADDVVKSLDGIWIYSNGTAKAPLVYDTYPLYLPPTKMLYAGWNAIGFSDTVSASADEALTSVEAKWAYLIGFDATNQTYETSIINNAISEAHNETRLMYPKKGYWIYMTEGGELAGV